MFGGGNTNPYDEIVVKSTDENLTSENWELILNLCDKVADEGEGGARSVIASVLKRLAHRNPNVQLYALSLAESLSKNCGIEVHRELASKAFTQGLEKLVTDRTTHDKVKRRTLSLIGMWTVDFQKDTSLGVMEDCYNNLKAKGHKFETPQEPLPLAVDDEIRRKEEEELQRVLEMSMQDKGGRGQWSAYSAVSSSGAGGSGSSSISNIARTPGVGTSKPAQASSSSFAQTQQKTQQHTLARTPSSQSDGHRTQSFQPLRAQSQEQQNQTQQSESQPLASSAPSNHTSDSSAAAVHAQGKIVTRVRALHTFEATEPGELAFERGDVIKVVDRGYKDWWRGQLKGRTGIFPVNYVEALPEPTPAELAREAEQEAAVFAQAVNVEKLLNMLRSFDPAKDSLADNEEIQELYRSSMALRPKIVKLIDKYSQKRADLVSMNETFVRARTIFERMMEESLARHTGVYPQDNYNTPHYRPSSAGRPTTTRPQNYAWNPNGYNTFPTPYPTAQPDPTAYVNPPFDPNTAAAAYAQQYHAQPVVQHQAAQGQHLQSNSSQPGQPFMQQGGYLVQQSGGAYGPPGQPPYTIQQAQSPAPVRSQSPQSQQQSPAVLQHQLQQLSTPAQTIQPQPIQPVQVQQQKPGDTIGPQANHTEPEHHPTTSQPQQIGPPYVFDPETNYADPNVQAWAQYYAKGGKDPQGAVYFVSVPGVKDGLTSLNVLQPEQQSPQIDTLQPVQNQRQQLETSHTPAQQSDILPSPSKHGSVSSIGSLPYPGDVDPSREYTPATSQLNSQVIESSPAVVQQFAPTNTVSTPSWVIPKRTATPTQAAAGTMYLDNVNRKFGSMSVGGDTS